MGAQPLSSDATPAGAVTPPKYAVVLIPLLLVAIRVFAPEDLDHHQGRQISPIMDILHGGSLAYQQDANGIIATKPPLYNWLAAELSVVFGTRALWVMKLPALLSGLGLLVLIHAIARRMFDPVIAAWSVIVAASTHHFSQLVWYARTDMTMTFLVYMAIFAILTGRMTHLRAAAVGLLLALNILTKGPVGPVLVLLWLMIWAWNLGALGRWREALPWLGTALAVMLIPVAPWVAAIATMPQFVDGILLTELGGKFTGENLPERSVFHYVPIILQRNIPWSLVALGAVYAARRGPEWKSVRLLAIWVAVYFMFFTLFPSRRGDRLLPVYPPLYMLAAIGLNYLFETRHQRKLIVAGYVLAPVIIIAPIVMSFMSKHGRIEPMASILMGAAVSFGALALWSAYRRRAVYVALFVTCGWMAVDGTDVDGVLRVKDVRRSEALRAFAAGVNDTTQGEPMLVYDSDLLVSYVLNVHPRGARPDDAPAGSLHWLVTRTILKEDLERRMGSRLEPVAGLAVEAEGGEHALYRVVSPHSDSPG